MKNKNKKNTAVLTDYFNFDNTPIYIFSHIPYYYKDFLDYDAIYYESYKNKNGFKKDFDKYKNLIQK